MTSPLHSVEICMISTPDGVIDVNGRSRPLGGPADQARLIALRGGAAVILVGAGTARTENYGPPSKAGLRIAVVTKSCALDFSSPLFSSGAGLVATTVNAPALSVDTVRAGDTDVDMAGIIAQLPHGIVHVEGGPMLNAALLDADCVDAINLTMSPRVGGFRGPSLSQAPHALRHFTCVSLTTDSDFVFARYEKVTTA
ncbi:MAG: dihydrofolate reductase family protein [Actinobacteria bacterium]|nr:dihydrofolate reductase family protein [Actinomycetota bacterium]